MDALRIGEVSFHKQQKNDPCRLVLVGWFVLLVESKNDKYYKVN